MTTKKSDNIAFIFPVKNEEDTIYEILSSTHQYFPEAFICVVINGSEDDSKIRSENFFKDNKIDNNKYLVLNLGQSGKSNAIKQALKNVQADNYVLMDSDNQHNDTEAIHLLHAAKTHNVDMLVGNRFLNNSKTSYFKSQRQTFNLLFNKLVRNLFKIEVTDELSGFRILSNRFVETLEI